MQCLYIKPGNLVLGVNFHKNCVCSSFFKFFVLEVVLVTASLVEMCPCQGFVNLYKGKMHEGSAGMCVNYLEIVKIC